MTSHTATETSPLIYARVAGILYLSIVPLAIFSQFYVLNNFVVPGDAATTANNIVASEGLFRIGLVGWLIIFLIEIVLSVILYILLKPVSKTLSLVAMVSRLTMTAVQGISLLILFIVLLLSSGAAYLTVFDTGQLHALVLLFLDAHSYGYAIGMIFFSLHTFVLGYLVFRSGYFPRILGVLFVIASLGYLIDSFAILFSASYEETPVFIAIPIAAAELIWPLWLLFKGVNVEQWKKRALESA